MPSVSFKQHGYWVSVLENPLSSERQKTVAEDFLDEDKKEGIWQDKYPGMVTGLIKKDGKYLLLFNNKQKKWASPGGKIEWDETHLNALKRELKEEVGIEVRDAKLVFKGKFAECIIDTSFYIYVIKDFVGEPMNIEKEKHSDMRWLTKSEIKNFMRMSLLAGCDVWLLQNKKM